MLALIIAGFPLDCQDYPYNSSGTYVIQLAGGKPIVGLCEPDNDRNWLVSDVRLVEKIWI